LQKECSAGWPVWVGFLPRQQIHCSIPHSDRRWAS
jgi:hypothetical protein